MPSNTERSLSDQLRRDQASLDDELRRRVGIDVTTWKALRYALRVIGIIIAAAAMFEPTVSSDPIPTLTIIAAFVLGPDVVEAYLTHNT